LKVSSVFNVTHERRCLEISNCSGKSAVNGGVCNFLPAAAGEVIHASVPAALIAVQMASASSGIEERQAPVWLRLGNSSNAALQHVLSTTLLQALELLRSGEPWVEIRPQTTPET
jgi:hypothetical protein